MTTYEPLDRTLEALFAEEAITMVRSDLADRIVSETARLQPRRAWHAWLREAGRSGRSLPWVNLTGQSHWRTWMLVALALILGLAAFAAGARLLDRPSPLRGVFVPAGSLTIPATDGIVRPDGQVLIFGGEVPAANGLGSLAGTPESIVLYDPVAGTSRTIGATSASVDYAVPLADGRVLAVQPQPSPPPMGVQGGPSTASLIDPDTGQVVELGATSQDHLSGAGVQLADGHVLLVGDGSGTTEAELFDPTTGTFVATSSTSRPMMQPTATLLPDGRVLVVGQREPIAEIYDPTTGTFTKTGPMSGPHEAFTATLLGDGRVVIVGGWATNGTVIDGNFYASEPVRLGSDVEIFDPGTGQFTQAGPMVTPRIYHFATALADGRVLIGGGSASPNADAGSGGIVDPVALQAEIFDPATGTFSPSGMLSTARIGAGAVRLLDGRVLVIGTLPLGGGAIPIPPPGPATLEVFE